MSHPEPSPGVPTGEPLYRTVVRQLREALARGEWRPGDAIPSERHLAKRFAVSIGTLRKAIDELVAGHLLIRQQGRGTFVASHNRDRFLFYFFHVVPQQGAKAYPEVRLVRFARGRADRDEARMLGLAAGEAVIRVRNLLELEGLPVIVDDLSLPAARFPGLTERRFAGRPSTIYNLYQDAFGVSVVRIRERLRAILAAPGEARLLGIAPGSPLLSIRRVAFSYNDEPVELRRSQVNTARHEYWAEHGASG